MSKRQHQVLAALCSDYGEAVDLLALDAPMGRARRWLGERGLPVRVLSGAYPLIARLNTALWYGTGVLLCNRLRIIDCFRFFIRTPLPQEWIDRYEIIVCYYAWPFHLLRLARAGDKAVVDAGDVMADRHRRIGSRRWVSLSAADEAEVLRPQSRCLAISDDDAREIEQRYEAQPRVLAFVPPEHSELIKLANAERPLRIGFLGAPSYVNEQVVRLLAEKPFLDGLRAAGIELLIAGGICETVDPSLLHALMRGGARILGRVNSLVEYYRQIGATVNPVGPSSGAKIKSIETLVAGRGLITTRWGADAALAAAFLGQVEYVDWPVSPARLAELCVRAVGNGKPRNQAAGIAYVRKAAEAFGEVLAR